MIYLQKQKVQTYSTLTFLKKRGDLNECAINLKRWKSRFCSKGWKRRSLSKVLLQQVQPFAFSIQINRASMSQVLDETTISKENQATKISFCELTNWNQVKTKRWHTKHIGESECSGNFNCPYVCNHSVFPIWQKNISLRDRSYDC